MSKRTARRIASIGGSLAAIAFVTIAPAPVASASDQQCGFEKVGYDTSQQVCLGVTGSGLKVTDIEGTWNGSPPAAPLFQFYVNGALKYTHQAAGGTYSHIDLPASFDHTYPNNTQMVLCIARHGFFDSTCTQVIYVHS